MKRVKNELVTTGRVTRQTVFLDGIEIFKRFWLDGDEPVKQISLESRKDVLLERVSFDEDGYAPLSENYVYDPDHYVPLVFAEVIEFGPKKPQPIYEYTASNPQGANHIIRAVSHKAALDHATGVLGLVGANVEFTDKRGPYFSPTGKIKELAAQYGTGRIKVDKTESLEMLRKLAKGLHGIDEVKRYPNIGVRPGSVGTRLNVWFQDGQIHIDNVAGWTWKLDEDLNPITHWSPADPEAWMKCPDQCPVPGDVKIEISYRNDIQIHRADKMNWQGMYTSEWKWRIAQSEAASELPWNPSTGVQPVTNLTIVEVKGINPSVGHTGPSPAENWVWDGDSISHWRFVDPKVWMTCPHNRPVPYSTEIEVQYPEKTAANSTGTAKAFAWDELHGRGCQWRLAQSEPPVALVLPPVSLDFGPPKILHDRPWFPSPGFQPMGGNDRLDSKWATGADESCVAAKHYYWEDESDHPKMLEWRPSDPLVWMDCPDKRPVPSTVKVEILSIFGTRARREAEFRLDWVFLHRTNRKWRIVSDQ